MSDDYTFSHDGVPPDLAAALSGRAAAYDLSSVPLNEPPPPTTHELAEAALAAVHELAMRLGVPTQAMAEEGMEPASPGSLAHGVTTLTAAVAQVQQYLQGNDARVGALTQWLCKANPGRAHEILRDVSAAQRVAVDAMEMDRVVKRAKRGGKR